MSLKRLILLAFFSFSSTASAGVKFSSFTDSTHCCQSSRRNLMNDARDVLAFKMAVAVRDYLTSFRIARHRVSHGH